MRRQSHYQFRVPGARQLCNRRI